MTEYEIKPEVRYRLNQGGKAAIGIYAKRKDGVEEGSMVEFESDAELAKFLRGFADSVDKWAANDARIAASLKVS